MSCRQRESYARQLARQGKATPTSRYRREVPVGKKWCPGCKTFLALDAFGSNRAQSDGLTTYCRPCHNAKGKAFYTEKYGSTRHYHLRRRYGLGAAEVAAMIEAQGGLCAACGIKEPKHVDHDHDTGAVRGILCFTCNVALGNVKDNLSTLQLLASYLERHAGPGADDEAVVARLQRALAGPAPAAVRRSVRAGNVIRDEIAPGVWRLRDAG
jgi:hypothetical protein